MEPQGQRVGRPIQRGTRRARFAAGLFAMALAAPVLQSSIQVTRNEAALEFPTEIEFHLSASGAAEIREVELTFGTDALACGDGSTRTLPDDFTPGASVSTSWTWNLRTTGSLPPGTRVWWQWKIADVSGASETTSVQELVFNDPTTDWKQLASGPITLYWLVGSQAFAQALLDSALEGMASVREQAGVEAEGDIRIYVYPDSQSMQADTLFAPAWSGGLAFAHHGAVLAAIAPGELEWGREVLVHELTHVLVGRHVFSCVATLPIWLNEGLATYFEGELRESMADLLAEAVAENRLLSVRSLGNVFSNDPDLALLAYAESYSLVDYLLQTHGPEPMARLLELFRDGSSEDRALLAAYGMDRDGLEAAWREWLGAAPMSLAEAGASATAAPTLAPIGGVQPEPTPTAPASTAEKAKSPKTRDLSAEPPEGAKYPTQDATRGLGGEEVVGLIVGTLIVALAIGARLRRQKSQSRADQPATDRG